MLDNILEAERTLLVLLGPQVAEIAKLISDQDSRYVIEMPNSINVDQSVDELLSLVARSSNVYGRLAKFAGATAAEFKLAKGNYDRKYKKTRVGKNEDERERNAMYACEEEHSTMIIAEAIASYADYLERAARVASETARKLLDKAQAMQIAQTREQRGKYADSDFAPY